MPVSDTVLLLSLLLLLRVGHALLISGSVRSKNAAGAIVRLLLDLSVACLALWAIGAAFVPVPAGDETRYITWSHFLGIGESSRVAFRVLPYILIATAAVQGATAERTRVLPVLIVTGLIAIVLPILEQISFRTRMPDSGIGLACLLGGSAALVAANRVGARKGKFNRDQSVNFVPGHNIALQLVGLLVLMVAFVGISPSAGTLLCASAAALAGAAFGSIKFGKIDTGLTIAATLGGLCAGGVGLNPTWIAVLVGITVGTIVPFAVMTLEVRFRIDDVTAAIPTHLVGGLVGLAVASLVAFVREPSWWIFAWAALCIATIVIGGAIAFCVFFVLNSSKRVRVTEDAEFDGTDLAELDVNAYPDFQQTMIKSYHLREM